MAMNRDTHSKKEHGKTQILKTKTIMKYTKQLKSKNRNVQNKTKEINLGQE